MRHVLLLAIALLVIEVLGRRPAPASNGQTASGDPSWEAFHAEVAAEERFQRSVRGLCWRLREWLHHLRF